MFDEDTTFSRRHYITYHEGQFRQEEEDIE